MEEIESVWDLPERPTEPVCGSDDADFEEAMANYKVNLEFFKKKEKILAWCASEFLSMAVGVETWGNTQKCTKLITDKVKLQEDNSGKAKVLAPATSAKRESIRRKWESIFCG